MPHATDPASTRIPVLVAGTGHGLRVLVPALRAAGFEVVGLVGADPVRTGNRAARSSVPHAFIDLDTAVTKSGAVAVAIATPPRTHASLVHTALARGCHVLCEKPFARDAEEARGMLAAAERAGVVHMMGYQFRMNPERVLMARSIAQGLIGEPRLISITHYTGLLADPAARWPDWWFDSACGGRLAWCVGLAHDRHDPHVARRVLDSQRRHAHRLGATRSGRGCLSSALYHGVRCRGRPHADRRRLGRVCGHDPRRGNPGNAVDGKWCSVACRPLGNTSASHSRRIASVAASPE